MSNNIDYDELDKAVHEAIQSRNQNSQNLKSRATRPVVKKTTVSHPSTPQTIVVKNTTKPVNRGQYMDFVAQRPISSIAPTHSASSIKSTNLTTSTRPVTPKPTIKRVVPNHNAQLHPTTRVVNRSATPTSRTPIARPVGQHSTMAHPIAQRPISQNSAQQRSNISYAPASTTRSVIQTTPVHQNTESSHSTPNANNYSLGGRSPFMIDTKVEKRPLGTNIPETTAHNVHSTKNIYSQKSPVSSKRKANKHIVTESPNTHSGWIWTIITLLVIAAGAGLGYLAYTLVFPN